MTGRTAAGYSALLPSKALVALPGYLRGLGVAPQAEVMASATLAEELPDRYRRWLLAERGHAR